MFHSLAISGLPGVAYRMRARSCSGLLLFMGTFLADSFAGHLSAAIGCPLR